ncbi:MAG TPA: hypothetical protein VF439_03240 [Candidatus Paceibacterota bacterium]
MRYLGSFLLAFGGMGTGISFCDPAWLAGHAAPFFIISGFMVGIGFALVAKN